MPDDPHLEELYTPPDNRLEQDYGGWWWPLLSLLASVAQRHSHERLRTLLLYFSAVLENVFALVCFVTCIAMG